MNDITKTDEEIRQMYLDADDQTKQLILIAFAIGLSRLILFKFSYWFSKEVTDNGKD